MKIILDENIPRYLKVVLANHDVSSVQEKGWSGIGNSDLLSRIEGLFDVFITDDKNLKNQKNLINRKMNKITFFGDGM